MYIEMVGGLGDVLVGNSPGTPHRFVISKRKLPGSFQAEMAMEAIEFTGLSSKSLALAQKRPAIIFRSDSNGEDLKG